MAVASKDLTIGGWALVVVEAALVVVVVEVLVSVEGVAAEGALSRGATVRSALRATEQTRMRYRV